MAGLQRRKAAQGSRWLRKMCRSGCRARRESRAVLPAAFGPREGRECCPGAGGAHGVRMTLVMPVLKALAGERALPQTPRAPSWGKFLPVTPPHLRAEATFLLCVIWGA